MHSPTSESEVNTTTTMSNDDRNGSINGNQPKIEKNRNNVFVCGFLPTRLHNKQLNAVAHELMPNFFVCSNPTLPVHWSKQKTVELLTTAGAMIFLMNKFTLNDRYCITTLQYAYAAGLPVIMLRHPSMKLVVNVENNAKNNRFNESASVLRNAICESYKSSIEYDKSQHAVAMQKIVARLRSIFDDDSSASRLSSALDDADDNFLRLPAISPPPKSPQSHRPSSTAAATGIHNKLQNSIRIRSRSIGNFKHSAEEPTPTVRRQSVRSSNALHPEPRIIHLEKPINIRSPSNQKNRDNDTIDGTKKEGIERQISSRERTNDPTLYSETQYLVFHYHDKTQKPRLIKFPSDIILHDDVDDDDDGSSIWGSDTSLEEEEHLAPRLQGSFDVPTPPVTPKPYIEPL